MILDLRLDGWIGIFGPDLAFLVAGRRVCGADFRGNYDLLPNGSNSRF